MTITLTNRVTEVTAGKRVTTITEEEVPHHVMIERLRNDILAYGPEHFNMSTWFDSNYGNVASDLNAVVPEFCENYGYEAPDFNRCGTTGCLAGHVAAFARRHDFLDLITETNENDMIPRVEQRRIHELLGSSNGAFASSSSQWHHVAQVAYRTELDRACDGVYWLVSMGDEDDMTHQITAEEIVDDGPGEWVYDYDEYRRNIILVDNGEHVDRYSWIRDAVHRAEWVAICTYLQYIYTLSYKMAHGHSTFYFPEADVERIQNSPAYSAYHTNQD